MKYPIINALFENERWDLEMVPMYNIHYRYLSFLFPDQFRRSPNVGAHFSYSLLNIKCPQNILHCALFLKHSENNDNKYKSQQIVMSEMQYAFIKATLYVLYKYMLIINLFVENVMM